MKHYPNVEANPNFASIDKEIQDYWRDNQVFELSVSARPKDDEFIFFDGPPFANGLPHYGHLFTGFVKDVVARYQTMQGKRVERVFGWDCHGLPAEMDAEKQLQISGRLQIEKFGVEHFNAKCRELVQTYTNEWEEYVTKQARWVDFKNSYKTMDMKYMESVIWSFKQLYDKGLVYESMRVMPYSWACETPLSNFETRLDNAYRERADKAVTVSFKLKDKPANAPVGCTEYRIFAWTTTPWTLPSNLALAVGPDIDYCCVVNEKKQCLIIAKFALQKYAKELDLEQAQLYETKGQSLAGLAYEPLFPYFTGHANSFVILGADFVTEGDGTGIVHMAPGFGEDDQVVCAKHNIELVCPVDNAGKFTNQVPDLEGLQVFDANDTIIIKLKENGHWVKTEQYLHNYPHCWRTDTPLIYKALSSWYVKVTDIKENMLKNNEQINWIPENIKHGQFGKWLENARDWSISRNRFWGTPVPIWRSDDPKYPRIDVYGSIAELESDFGVKVTDLHKPFIDNLVRPNPDDPTGNSMMRRVPDVFDCWYESGSMPYAQIHYPFENKERFEQHPTADFIVEYVAQTRGWFYTLMVLSTALFDRPPFLNCICHGVILDENGQKLSKRLRNYTDPKDLFDLYGSDALRYLMMSSALMRGQDLLIDKDGTMVKDALRLYVKPIWNAYNFFTLYANADQIEAKLIAHSDNFNDRYILSKLSILIERVKNLMDNYDISVACKEINLFVETLNNWFIRRARPRFWQSEINADKQAAYDTLYTCLTELCKVCAPLMPVITEYIYLGLTKGKNANDSVHLKLYPDYLQYTRDPQLVESIDKVQEICTAALYIRNSENIRIRQPLAKLTIVGEGYDNLQQYFSLIEEEVNVKNVLISHELEQYATRKLKINFPLVGKRLPKKVKLMIDAVKNNQWQLTKEGKLSVCDESLDADEFTLILESKTDAKSATLPSQDAIVILDTNITEELEQEGIARDIVRMIQQARKDNDLHITDRIKVIITADDKTLKAVDKFCEYLKEQTLAKEITYNAGTLAVNIVGL